MRPELARAAGRILQAAELADEAAGLVELAADDLVDAAAADGPVAGLVALAPVGVLRTIASGLAASGGALRRFLAAAAAGP